MLDALLNDFHWLRPAWLWLLPAALILVGWLWRHQHSRNNWQAHVDAQLLPLLLDGQQNRQTRLPFIVLLVGLLIAALAMAGPSWEKIAQPVHKTESALIVMLDLSPSMLAEDLKPSRLVRARLKLIDLLKQRKEGLTALIVYAGEAHVVTPLTDDTETIISLLPAMSPQIMPLRGSNPEMALDQALTLLRDAGLQDGELLLVTDGVAPAAIDYLEDQITHGLTLSILGVGSDEGVPIPTANGGFAKDANGAIVISRLNASELQNLAGQLGGRYSNLRSDERDIDYLLQAPKLLDEQTRKINREFDTWQDNGPWLVLLLLPIALLSFRRGWILSLGFICLIPSEPSYAQVNPEQMAASPEAQLQTALANAPLSAPATNLWDDLWQTHDQQGQTLLQSDRAGQAASTFDDPSWRASAHYRAGEFAQAAENFSADTSATGQFNRGNALAKAGQLEDAQQAYQQALQQQPDFSDASSNLELIEQLLEQQKQQQEDPEEQSQDGQSQENSDQSSESQQQGEDGEPQDSQQQDDSQQQSDESSQQQSEQQNSDLKNSGKSESASEPEQKSAEKAESKAESQQNPEQSAAEQAAQQQAGEQGEENQDDPENSVDGAQALSEEQQQAMEQWLRQVPDDPSGLIRRKFEHQYHQRKEQYRAGTWKPPENQANQRW